ncbi:(2Fe-2S)-binding protein [Vibrio diabolicus]|uniref:(2Fe-2S)-binding protein n=1 Tax=Vibrio diabolicus TaxID=50719 RepID=UPI00211B5677|nr:(2Fe-2S)-binding protein [Vibrio diabolicus]MCG9229880.1 (2Fe-2S)-binding protein [Vibrio diabolicus]MCG9572610.1 (2Fe-2S)-binding protein [Vibrio diabolicus]MCG9593026.1 (2Fe-2S)-binding protein [Vibrio diabolicus]
MKTGSRFQRMVATERSQQTVEFFWEGKPYTAHVGDTIAAALLAAGVDHTRESPQSGAPRAPFCMMGSCFECRVQVNGEHNVQACMNVIEDGMTICRQTS